MVKALKGAGLLNLGDLGSDVPAAAAPVKAARAKATKVNGKRTQYNIRCRAGRC